MATQQKSYEGLIAESVRFPGHNGDPVDGYLARPLGTAPYPGVILIHEATGMLPRVRERAMKFAANGISALAVNLYSREGFSTETVAPGGALNDVSDERIIGDLEGAAAMLRLVPGSSGRLGCLGWCSGGRQTLLFACNTSSLTAAVACYPAGVVTDQTTATMPVPVIQMIERLSCPLLALSGEADQSPSPEQMRALEEELKRRGKSYELNIYPGDVAHGFFSADRPFYRQEAAVDAWERVFAFFRKHL